MTGKKFRPQTLPEMRAKFVKDALSSVIVCIAVATLFWSIGFGTGSSPSVPHLLVTVTLPAFIVRDCITYLRAKRTVDFPGQLPARESAA
ncbi:hypothetical protein [Brevibacterium marinum]|uniref:Uncharacterized protein n=1 Tax=Brevibacterium marinum TaxID=418643 RepID=A0A846S1Y4_9MICO|nr:hypothetical protein [Brevibacterium marinum]NJC56983.1 hypothetical protein [Brevibacterium marinum]